jgi:hypothetical protein
MEIRSTAAGAEFTGPDPTEALRGTNPKGRREGPRGEAGP